MGCVQTAAVAPTLREMSESGGKAGAGNRVQLEEGTWLRKLGPGWGQRKQEGVQGNKWHIPVPEASRYPGSKNHSKSRRKRVEKRDRNP